MGGSGKKLKDPAAEKKKAEDKEKKNEGKPKGKRPSQGPSYTILRVYGKDINADKPVQLAITKINGVGFVLANAIMKVGQFDPKEPLKDFTDEKLKKLQDIIRDPIKYGVPAFMVNRRKDPQDGDDKHLAGADLMVRTRFDVEDMVSLKTYRGWRHMHGQPVRGQRTRSKFREKGRVVGVLRKSVRIATGAPKTEEKK